ncbi:Ovate protein family, C-terminal [Dillenia turbinata]|uniref:Transcription repressor n=1 Tax=Dillenia turbinata TaxID=194707 RepID=A0AAN8VCC3_9MAGN
MENRFRLSRIPSILPSSLVPCRSLVSSDVIEKSLIVPKTHQNLQFHRPQVPKLHLYPSTTNSHNPKPSKSEEKSTPSNQNPVFGPKLPLDSYYKRGTGKSKFDKERKKRSKRISSSSADTNSGWFSSEEDFFSALSFSSDDSSDTHHQKQSNLRRKQRKQSKSGKKPKSRNAHMENFNEERIYQSENAIFDQKKGRTARMRRPVRVGEAGFRAIRFVMEGRVKESFAFEKSSSDPHGDFRDSMVEMIVEKQILESEELEEMLQRFLSLNSPYHHEVIVEVFSEIWQALFSN